MTNLQLMISSPATTSKPSLFVRILVTRLPSHILSSRSTAKLSRRFCILEPSLRLMVRFPGHSLYSWFMSTLVSHQLGAPSMIACSLHTNPGNQELPFLCHFPQVLAFPVQGQGGG